ncbi:hypothetical protein [Nonomuraea sp. SBT364]|uniref:hypothetical protein n=1 Tax=Nonomuraea sp. SBT364 TaxID=1580530 RepID=UPI00066CFF07|nr:hypothetical protein [Nonomuraea sp. SBT364]
MLEIHATIHMKGPVYDGRAPRVLDDFAQAAVDEVAEQGFRDIGFTLVRVLKHPTGHYQSRIRNRPIGPLTRVLYDDRVIYGWWLEGVGSRNSPVTRFEGYFTFRRVAQHLKKKAPQIAQQTLRRYIGRLQ